MDTNGCSRKVCVRERGSVCERERDKKDKDMLTLIVLFRGWHVIKILYQQVRPKRSSNGLCSDLLIEFGEEKFRSFR